MTTHTTDTATGPEKPPSRYEQSRQHIESYYGIPARKGMPVIFDNQPGTITGLRSQYLLVRLNNQPKNTPPLLCHPTWRMAYPTLDIEATE